MSIKKDRLKVLKDELLTGKIYISVNGSSAAAEYGKFKYKTIREIKKNKDAQYYYCIDLIDAMKYFCIKGEIMKVKFNFWSAVKAIRLIVKAFKQLKDTRVNDTVTLPSFMEFIFESARVICERAFGEEYGTKELTPGGMTVEELIREIDGKVNVMLDENGMSDIPIKI